MDLTAPGWPDPIMVSRPLWESWELLSYPDRFESLLTRVSLQGLLKGQSYSFFSPFFLLLSPYPLR
jgi:hypothetical protein